jgi:hypothetical protein
MLWLVIFSHNVKLDFYSVPRNAVLSIDSNKALKLPAPKPLAPIL